MIRLVFCVVLCFVLTRCQEEEETAAQQGKLVFAQIVYRHGDRTPVDPYPTDPWGSRKYWTTGWGQLTTTGMEQHYNLGKWIRNRYSSILPETYSKDAIYIRSTDVDRTLMSALSNLAGMFPPTGEQVWNPKLPWQPIPVHTVPEQLDAVLSGKKHCPAYDYALKELKHSDEYQQLHKKYKKLFEYLTENTGRKVNSLESVQKIYNCLFIEQLYNKTLPNWTKDVYPGDMKWIAARSFATNTYTRQLARFKGGPLLKEMLQRFKDKSLSILKPDLAMWVYSAHDTTVANILNTMKLFEIHSPPYVASVLLEMRLYNDKPFISIYYKNSTFEPLPLYIPDCGTSCPLEKMFDLYNDVLPVNWESECELSMLSMTYEEADVTAAMAIVACGALVVFSAIIIFAGITYYRRRNYFDYRWYLNIDT